MFSPYISVFQLQDGKSNTTSIKKVERLQLLQLYNSNNDLRVQLKGRPLHIRNIRRYPLWAFRILPLGVVMCTRAVEHDGSVFESSGDSTQFYESRRQAFPLCTKLFVGVVLLSSFGGNFVLAKAPLGLVSVHCLELRGLHFWEVRNVLIHRVKLGRLCSIFYPLWYSNMLKIVPMMPKIMPYYAQTACAHYFWKEQTCMFK